MARAQHLIVLTGPTCSGKTSCAMKLGQSFPIEVVSADSMQVYRFMDIATAKPTPEQRQTVPHHLIDVADPDEQFNAAIFADLARAKIDEIRSRGNIPVVVGGTGLYIKALVYGLAPAPPSSPHLRRVLTELARRRGAAYLASMLKRLDPECAGRVAASDMVRTVRFLEMIFLTGRKASLILKGHGFSRAVVPARIACIMPERDLLYADINTRTEQMFASGVVEETARLLDMGYAPTLGSMRTLAYRHVVRYLSGEIDLETCISHVKRDTRRFARRQMTWFRSQQDLVFVSSTLHALDLVRTWIDDECPVQAR